MDIVYTVKNTPTNEELIFSLRSLRNLPHDRVYFIGGCPANINRAKVKVVFTEVQATKYRSTTHNLAVAAGLDKLSEDFIWMNDDFFILQKIADPLNEFNLNKGTIQQVLHNFLEKNEHHLTKYMYGAQQTMEYLHRIGIKDPLSYELHTPFIYNKSKVRQMFALSGIDKVPILHKRSVYGNMFIQGSTYARDVKVLRASPVDFQEWSSRKFLSSSDITWSKVKPFLQARFKEACEYEL